jgi:hypothetical protein
MSNKFQQMTESMSDIDFTDVYAITKVFKTESEFSQYIETTAMSSGDSLIDTILTYCDTNDIDEELIAKLISTSLKEKIHLEAVELRLLGSIESGVLDI